MTAVSTFVSSIIALLVMGVLLLAGIVVTAMGRRAHGRAAILGMTGCILLLLGVIFNMLRGFLTPLLMETFGADLGVAFSILTIFSLIFDATGTGLLIWAVVARRPQQQPAQPQGPGWQQPPGDWQQQHPQQGWNQPPQQPPFQQPPGWQPPPRPPFGEGQG
jgi:membrane-bound ClpP family serine protease